MNQSDVFIQPTENDWIEAAPGVRRRILGHDGELMMVEVAFEAGGIGEPHSHPHIQISYVASGLFEMTIGDRTVVLNQGDSFRVPGNVTHSCKALEAGVLIDAFTPTRADFLE